MYHCYYLVIHCISFLFFFSIKNSFFVSDYSLHCYFYDFNYLLSDRKYNDCIDNLIIKTFIEYAYWNGNIDLSYLLIQTIPDIENYKETYNYQNNNTMERIVEKTDIQEMFSFLHEATHYLCKHEKSHPTDEFVYHIKKLTASSMIKTYIDIDSDMIEECYCDFKSLIYILDTTYSENKFSKSEYFESLFLALVYMYVLQFIHKIPKISGEAVDGYMDSEMKLLCLRLGCMYSNITNYLFNLKELSDFTIVSSTYDRCVNLFLELGNKMRVISQNIRCVEDNYKYMFQDIGKDEKIHSIKTYLNVLY